MKNPLNKRYIRELKKEWGKYLVIFLFMVMLISLVSGYLVTADSIEKTFYEGWDKYNIEDGHITFNMQPEETVLKKIEEKGDLKFYDLRYFEENLNGGDSTVRVYKLRETVDKQCVMTGALPSGDNEIALDRIFAKNNNVSVGDTISLNNKQLKVTGIIALVDYNSMFQNASDMMFNAMTFGVGIMTGDGYDSVGSSHQYQNYAWKYNHSPADETEEDAKSEDLLDVLEDVIKEYDTAVVQAEVDDLYAEAGEISDELEDKFDKAESVIKDRIETAAADAGTKAVASLSDQKKLELYMKGADAEEYMEAAAAEQGTTTEGLVAAELGCSEQALKDLEDAAEDMENTVNAAEISTDPPTISLDDTDETYENEMDFSLDSIRDIVAKIDAVGLVDVSEINRLLDRLDELMNYEFNEDNYLTVDNYVPKYQNRAITYCMDDMAGDRPMYMVFDYIVIVILAFIFAITISNTIAAEAGAIGTLRASGYSRGELIRHYMFLPIIVAVAACVVGNILGYTVFVEFYKAIFYNSFCLAPYESVFNTDAFINTTVFPMLLMIVINLIVLSSKMSLSPIRFLRHDLKKHTRKRALNLNKKIPFMHRFRLRILLQNIPSYITLMIGIVFGGMIAVFGWMFTPLLNDYSELIKESQLCEYQYAVKDHNETSTPGAEKYWLYNLNTNNAKYLADEISVYGIVEDSQYIDADIPDGEVLVTNGFADKFDLNPGDHFSLKEPYSDETYDFTVGDIFQYDGTLALFMNKDDFLAAFDKTDDDFTGYFSNQEITDIDGKDFAAVVTGNDLVDVANQLLDSMGSFMSIFAWFGMIMFLLLMYLMTKQIIEKNMQSIAMTKILGYRNSEIAGLYLVMTSIVVVISLLLSIPLIDQLLRWVFREYIYTEMTGYIPYIVSNSCYVKEFVLGVVCYTLISFFMMFKIGKIEKSEALKNME